jgi:hypothetical protein
MTVHCTLKEASFKACISQLLQALNEDDVVHRMEFCEQLLEKESEAEGSVNGICGQIRQLLS